MWYSVIVIWLCIVLFRGVALRIGRFWNRKAPLLHVWILTHNLHLHILCFFEEESSYLLLEFACDFNKVVHLSHNKVSLTFFLNNCHFKIWVNYALLLLKMLELYSLLLLCLNIHSHPLKRKMYTPLPYKMLELQSSPLIIKYALHFNLLWLK